jgi:hypothetical protein
MVKLVRQALLILVGLLLVSETIAQKGKEVLLLGENEPVPQNAKRLKRVVVGGDDASAAYNYSDILNRIEEIAGQFQADLIKIEEHQKADRLKKDRVIATLYAIEGVEEPASEPVNSEGDFVWNKNRKLCWNDFRGNCPRLSKSDLTVAATYCGFGYDMSYKGTGRPQLSIKNRFYVGKSWGLPAYQNPEVLAHEQAHFDLCEIYTRKFRELANRKLLAGTDYKKIIQSVYDQVYSEYERQQQRYDSETDHGNNKDAQQRWLEHIERELSKTEAWAEA